MAKNKEEERETRMEEGITQAVTTPAPTPVTPAVTAPQPQTVTTESAGATMVYVGPNILPLMLKRFQVFRGGIPPYVTRAMEKIPEVKDLIVPVGELENMRQKIDKPGTNEARLFEVVTRAGTSQRAARDVK